MKTSNNTIQRIYKAELSNEFQTLIAKLKLHGNANKKLRLNKPGECNKHWIQLASECYQETFQSSVNSLNTFNTKQLNKGCSKPNLSVDTFSKILTAVNTIANFKKKTSLLKNPTFRVEIVSNNVKKHNK